MSPAEAVIRINRNDAVVIDIRPAGEFSRGHIIDAVNVPAAELKDAQTKLKKHQGKPLLVCCQSGTSSNAAVRQLRAAGFDDVTAIKGGIASWRTENLPLAAD